MLFARVGCDKKGPSILLIFKYINKQDVLFTNIGSKVVNGIFWDVNCIVINERKFRFQFWIGNPPKIFGQNDITLIYSNYMENSIN